jgi:hypothetical protein
MVVKRTTPHDHPFLLPLMNRLNDRAGLADAIGPENAQAILQHVDSAYPTAAKISNRNKWVGAAAKAVGLGGGLGYEAVRGLRGLLGGTE